MFTLAERMGRLGTESAFDVLGKARALERQGRDIIHLEIGEPDFSTPPHIVAAAKKALDDGYTHYGPTPGLPELRQAIARHVSETRGIPIHPDQVVVTPGAKPIMFFTILALVSPGDEVLLPDPGFPIYASVVRFAGGVPVPIALREQRDFGFDLDELERRAGPQTRLLILNSPQNPTGGVLSPTDLRRIAAVAQRHRIPVLSDEVYRRFSYGESPHSIASLPGMADLTILLDGFSKAYAMTGWRLGYGVMPVPVAEAVSRLMVNSNSCTASFTQIAGVAALEGDQRDSLAMVEAFRRRRDLVVAGLNAIPRVSCRIPAGAFYAFPNVAAFGRPAQVIADHLLQDAGVAVLAGTGFGQYGEGYVRLSYAASEARLSEALDRMAASLARLG
ncbi:MAG: pyridoxal phosphate-dependent aminotransferase [candidate division NC10 bacterium]|nr:pyridoxal phosphate-dependent aminotransferase [candidate division NC10 bacterium]MBI3085509.1 pyridoxal phosphate-dependent aminotransferase [candidate division NC10 bacterium]